MPNDPSLYTLTSDTTLATAIKDIILGLSITPKTSLIQFMPDGTTPYTAQIGDTQISVDDSRRFVPGGLLLFQDNLGEEPIVVKSKPDQNTITLDFTGVGYTGLRYAHTGGTVVYTNLFVDAPNFIDPMLSLGDPVIYIMAVDEEENLVAMRQVQSLYTFNIEYRRMLARPQNQQMNTNVWAFRQESKARADMDAIANALRTNPRLQTNTGIHAESLGDRSNSRSWITKSWRKLLTDDSMQEFIATMQVIVRALRESF